MISFDMIVVDVETTGLSERDHSLIEIGAVSLENPSNRFYISCQARQGSEISDIALKINGHTKEDIYDIKKPTQLEAISQFDKWLEKSKDCTLIGENPRFDLNFINQTYQNCGLKSPLGHRSIDLHTTTINNLLMRGEQIPLSKRVPVSGINSDFIMDYVGIPTEPNPHTGINGAIFEAEAYSRLIFGENLLPEFKDFPVPKYLQK